MKNTPSNQQSFFFYLLLLTALFGLVEISYFIVLKNSYISQLNILDQMHVPVGVLYPLFFFIFSQILVHLFFCVTVWLIALGVARYFQLHSHVAFNAALGIWGLSITTVLISNVYYFPNSAFSALFSLFLPNRTVVSILSKLLFFVMGSLSCIALLGWAAEMNKRFSARVKWAGSFLLISSILIIIFPTHSPSAADAGTAEKPNIILVGIDSLRPDFLSYFGHEKPTPFLDSFLQTAAVFNEAITPLARTFPSWTSILTGQYPVQHGVRTNLADQQQLNLSDTLPHILQKNGYDTIYASDEARFSNIDKNFGFQQIMTPPMGINDFLIGTFNDFPLSNLLINTVLGEWLFPYTYANRPAYVTYDPDTFLQALSPLLNQPRKKPLFLAVHFCLPHAPYAWKDLPEDDLSIGERYQASVGRADKQASDFFAMMKKYHLLDHAIVVLLSDHGEALELPGDRITEKELFVSTQKKPVVPRFYPASLENEAVNRSAGHGTDVLGLPQYHTLLAFKQYGGNQEKQYQGIINGVVTLLSIKPTLLQWLHIAFPHSSGPSLLKAILGKGKFNPPAQPVFLESDFSPKAILSIHPDIEEVLLQGIKIYQVDPVTLRLTVKKEMLQMIIDSKQYADIEGEWMLALYPQADHFQIPILVNLNSGRWTDNLHSSFARQSPADAMLTALKRFYGREIRVKDPVFVHK